MAEERSRYKGVFPGAMDMLEGSGVAVHVGSGDAMKIWHLPENLLKSKSTFFTAALEGGFAEGISRLVTLPEEDPDDFSYFVEWLYFGDVDGDQIAQFDLDDVVSLWTLGDRLGCPLMQDDAMCDLVASQSKFQIGEVTLKQIYEESAPESKIRRFAIDKCLLDIRQGCPGCSYLRFAKENEDFAQQFAEATILLGSGEPNDLNCDARPYLFAPSAAKSKTRSGS